MLSCVSADEPSKADPTAKSYAPLTAKEREFSALSMCWRVHVNGEIWVLHDSELKFEYRSRFKPEVGEFVSKLGTGQLKQPKIEVYLADYIRPELEEIQRRTGGIEAPTDEWGDHDAIFRITDFLYRSYVADQQIDRRFRQSASVPTLLAALDEELTPKDDNWPWW